MSVYSARNAGLSPTKKFCIFFALLIFGGLGTTAALAAAGLVDLSLLSFRREPSRVGCVLVPISGRVLPVYGLVQRDDLCDPNTGLWNEVWLPLEAIAPDTVIDRTKIMGRVLNHEKGAGFAFRETDFMPPGTRFGMVAGIPLGKRSVVLEATKIGGLHALQKGDRFDIVATLPVDKSRQHAGKESNAALPLPEPEVRVLVTNGAVVMPAHFRVSSNTAPSLLHGPRTTTKSVEEVAIAVDPEEIAGLTASLSSSATITCVARSGHPDEPNTPSATPGSTPQPQPIAVETVIGAKRSTRYFPNPKAEPTEQAVADAAKREPLPDGATGSAAPREIRQARRDDARLPRLGTEHQPGQPTSAPPDATLPQSSGGSIMR